MKIQPTRHRHQLRRFYTFHLKGFTLIELIIVIAIVGIVLTLSMPNMQGWYEKYRSHANVGRLAQLLHTARELAVTRNQFVTICPTINNISCSTDWSKGYMVFGDNNQNAVVDANEFITQLAPPIPRQASLKWKAFANLNRISFTPQGYTLTFNGTFTYCGKVGDAKTAHLLILNKPGRVRFGKDNNGDGIPEQPNGNPATCG